MGKDDPMFQVSSTPPSPLNIAWEPVGGTILFADIHGFFRLTEKMPHDALAALVSDLYSLWSHEIRRQNGDVSSYIYDSVLALFRKEQCAGKDPEWCATLAAFHIEKSLKRFRPELSVNIGIQSGEFLEGSWEEGRPRRILMGNRINRAATMASGKNRGIFAGPEVVEILGPRVKTERCVFKIPNSDIEESVFRLVALNL